MEGLKEFLQLLSGLGGMGVMGIFVYLWLRGELRSKREVERADKLLETMTADRDRWQNVALRSLENNRRIQDTTDRAVGAMEQAITTSPSGVQGQGGQK